VVVIVTASHSGLAYGFSVDHVGADGIATDSCIKIKVYFLDIKFSSLDTEWPGLIVSIMAFLSVYFVGRMLEQRKRIMATQNSLIEELEAQNAELERFTYTISHDLKTPLVTINGLLGYLQRDIDQGKKMDCKAT
jgi:signal transduction histidine kinase